MEGYVLSYKQEINGKKPTISMKFYIIKDKNFITAILTVHVSGSMDIY